MHYGHECELQHVWIRETAAKLQQRAPCENILDTIRTNVCDQVLHEYLTDDEGIKKIKKSFGIDTAQSHQNDKDIVLSWIKEWSETEYFPLLFFKLQGQSVKIYWKNMFYANHSKRSTKTSNEEIRRQKYFLWYNTWKERFRFWTSITFRWVRWGYNCCMLYSRLFILWTCFSKKWKTIVDLLLWSDLCVIHLHNFMILLH